MTMSGKDTSPKAAQSLKTTASATSPYDGNGGATPTIWGLSPRDLHDRFWASRGVQVIRHGQNQPLAEQAHLFLLVEPATLTIFELNEIVELMDRAHPMLLYVRIEETRRGGARERVVTDDRDRFVRIERVYDRPFARRTRAAITTDRRLADAWQSATHPRDGWRSLRALLARKGRMTIQAKGMHYDGLADAEVAAFVRDLTRCWLQPSATIPRCTAAGPRVWADPRATIEPGARLVGPVWVGAGRSAGPGALVVGPAVLWDAPEARPAPEPIPWGNGTLCDIHPGGLPPVLTPPSTAAAAIGAGHAADPDASAAAFVGAGGSLTADDNLLRQARHLHAAFKRTFDIAFAIFALLLTLPFYPFIMLAILIEDGRPIFFAHRRETLGGREFPCIKFRSMRNNAEQVKAALVAQNQADGPQFFMEKDPRLTRVGAFLRRYRIDEFPQFINVLLGHMSVVGPRPSPFKENQFCPAWREARLSVRPGITGLWQVKRTRAPGTDFQEWIRYDIEYVERACWSLDLAIIVKTIAGMFKP